ncbi:mpv17-like protein isoform X1 [Harmonia axyridis]|uniref:mpv17-like protein isoform X1 n=1 Tax=Harmonia axyridis TaxID=115357 RepID=UPI001E278E5C|nr:mpv17-like protein isoform X1 [Harmonia axyridis]
MVAVLSRFVAFTNRHPIVRGMISYATIWPVSNIIQQSMAGKTLETYDWTTPLRFSIYGGLFTAPTLYAWVRFTTIMWPTPGLKTAVFKAVVEQMTYGPAALICFYFGISLMEGKGLDGACEAVNQKFLPSWQVGIFFWPVLQTINFAWVPEKNRVPYVSACSLVWCCFLSYMHQLQLKKMEKQPVDLNSQAIGN